MVLGSVTRSRVLSDVMRAWIEPVLPPLQGRMGRPMRDHRLLVEATIWRYRTGSPPMGCGTGS